MIEERVVRKRYKAIIELARNYSRKGNEEKAAQCVSLCAQYMYENNFEFVDFELEKLGNALSDKYKIEISCQDNTILFYQYYPKDTRGLAYIYIKALINTGIRFVWVTYKSFKTEKQRKLMELALSTNNCSIVTLDDTVSKIHLIKEWHSLIKETNPRWALFISAPWDIEGVSAIGCYKNIEKILVNGTDHTFWYGASVFDKILEFRDWGRQISIEYRDIEDAKLVKFPYYPCPSNETFCGFPFSVSKDTKIIVSGGSLYKIYGSGEFLETVKYILNKHTQCVFYYMGNGDKEPILRFIHENNFENRFYITEERKDFDEVIKRSYLYLNTYPLIGALMVQYAVANNVIPVGLNSSVDGCNDISGLFLRDGVSNCNSLDELWHEIDLLIEDDDYYLKRKNELQGKLICEPEFSGLLKDILMGCFSGFPFNEAEVDVDELRLPYLERQNRIKSGIVFWKRIIKILM